MENFETKTKNLPVIAKVLIGMLGGAGISGLLLYLGLVGVLPALLVFQAFIVGAVVYGFGDIYGAAAIAVTALIGMYSVNGAFSALLMLVAFVLPYAAYVFMSEKNLPFFKLMGYSMGAMGVGILVCLVIITRSAGSDIGKLLSDTMNESLNALSAETKQSLAELYASFYAVQNITLDTSDPSRLLSEIALQMEDMTKLVMPSLLVGIIIENAALGTLIGGFIRFKRNVPGAGYNPVSHWRLPAKITIGVILFVILGAVLARTQGAQGEVILFTALCTAYIACTVQTIASVYSKLSMIGVRFIFRLMWIVLLVVGLGPFPLLYGSLSALFGSYGLFKQLRSSGSNNKNGGIS